MINQEVMVVLSDGKPVTVIRSRQSDSSCSSDRTSPGQTTAVAVAASARISHASADEVKNAALNRELRGKEFEEHIELKRLRTENRILQQRIDNLEQVLNKRGDDRAREVNQSRDDVISNNNSSGHEMNIASASAPYDSGDNGCHCRREMAPGVLLLPSDTSRVYEFDSGDSELQRIQDELIACKLREAEANLSMKEFQQKVNQLERHWQQFLQENRSSGNGSSGGGQSSSQTDLKDTVMALRLRETYLVCDLNLLKQKLMELETQNHIYERQIKRQESEQLTLQEAITAAELRERELLNTIVQLERRVSDCETKGKEDVAMSRIRDAEHSHVLAEMRRRIAEVEIENQELVTSAKLHNRDSDVRDLESKISSELQYELSCGRNVDNFVCDDVTDTCLHQDEPISFDMTSSLLLVNTFGQTTESDSNIAVRLTSFES